MGGWSWRDGLVTIFGRCLLFGLVGFCPVLMGFYVPTYTDKEKKERKKERSGKRIAPHRYRLCLFEQPVSQSIRMYGVCTFVRVPERPSQATAMLLLLRPKSKSGSGFESRFGAGSAVPGNRSQRHSEIRLQLLFTPRKVLRGAAHQADGLV